MRYTQAIGDHLRLNVCLRLLWAEPIVPNYALRPHDTSEDLAAVRSFCFCCCVNSATSTPSSAATAAWTRFTKCPLPSPCPHAGRSGYESCKVVFVIRLGHMHSTPLVRIRDPRYIDMGHRFKNLIVTNVICFSIGAYQDLVAK